MRLIQNYQEKVNDLRNSGFNVRIEHYFQRGFELFRKRADLFLIYTALYLLVMPFGGFIVSAPLTAGFFIAAHRLNRMRSLTIDHFFEGFQQFLPLLLFTLISGLILFVAYLALIVPGIYLTVAYTFALPFIIFGRTDFREAMELSRRLISREWISFLVLLIVVAAINILGALAFGVGLLFSIPISYCALYVAFDEIAGISD
jgi:uncharacterized membrane protein